METNPQNESREQTPNVQGIDLRIDGSIDKLCEVSNSTSNNTRSLWYVIVIVSTLSFAEFWNTHPFNYASQRLEHYRDSVIKLQNRLLKADRSPGSDSSNYELQFQLTKELFSLLNSNAVANIQTVKIPILGNTFDVSDIGLFAGFSFIVLLLILKFILTRKVSSLKIALNSITNRYSDEADEKYFTEFLDKSPDKMKALEAINLNRRKYHYDFLSMKEIFSVPDDEIPGEAFYDTSLDWFRKRIFYIPLAVSILLLFNDLVNTYISGWGYDKENHVFLIVVSIIYIFIIYVVSKRCTGESQQIEDLYENFKSNNYKYVPAKD
ncbi:MAG TPA: hypothetical protein VE978_00040 [Chitinophagales bacterium]|nr:hypothetical protein [Chitinophagales bacterium]